MGLERFALTKDEVAMNYPGDDLPAIQFPIHPKFLDPHIRLDPKLPLQAFEIAVGEFYDDLTALAESGNYSESAVNHWKRAFLEMRPCIVDSYGRPRMDLNGSGIGVWGSDHGLASNGFMDHLSIDRDNGGSFYFNLNDDNCRSSFHPEMIGRGLIRITDQEKALAYSSRPTGGRDSNGIIPVDVYATHNIDQIPGALMLRNWALAYNNLALRSIDE